MSQKDSNYKLELKLQKAITTYRNLLEDTEEDYKNIQSIPSIPHWHYRYYLYSPDMMKNISKNINQTKKNFKLNL